MTQLIIAPPISEAPAIAISQEALSLKANLLAHAADMQAVTTIEQRDSASLVAGRIKAHIKDVETQHDEAKKPFWDIGKEITDIKKKHLLELESALARLNRMNGEFEEARRRQQEAEQRAIAAEAARVLAEQQKAEREALRLAEEARKKEEAAAAKGRELSDAQKAKALAVQLEADEAAEELKIEQERLAEEQRKAGERAAQAAPTGGSLRTEIDIEVTDIHALYRACPQAVRMKEDVAFIKTMAKAGVKYPGVLYSERPDFRTRVQR